jgi:hypothetical protein
MKYLFLALALLITSSAHGDNVYTLHIDQPKQVIRGLGFEIQSDSIGSGNHGLPADPIAVPHDLLPAERDRLAHDMLKGFRYCRLAGGLYWRGLDKDQKHLQPRWPAQLTELRELLDTAGVEGLSFEYWSPAPFWKANRSYVALPDKGGRAANVLRCFAPGWESDSDYHGDTDRFLADFADAVVTDIKTLRAAGIKTSMFGLQNEPDVNHTIYSTCEYPTSPQYVQAYCAVARAVRKHDPSILLFADTEGHFPKKIGPAMTDPEIASLVDAYAVHIVGSPSSVPQKVHAEIQAKLPPRPWFQNEYEYLTGGATPERCLNTVEHILNSFQLAENPTWFWIHCLKPLKNAEASGYSLGFWKSLIEPATGTPAEQLRRWPEGPEFSSLPDQLKQLEMVSAKFTPASPAIGYHFLTNQPVTVYLLAQNVPGLSLDPAWQKTDLTATWPGGSDLIYRRSFDTGRIDIPAPPPGASPHLAFVEPASPSTDRTPLKLQIGINLPIEIRSQALALQRLAASIKPGTWIFNPYNFNAVGSFVRHLPWDSVALNITESHFDPHARLLAFRRPDGKVTIVLSNSSPEPRTFDISTNLPHSTWKPLRYTPDQPPTTPNGTPLPPQSGPSLKAVLPPLTWEFWEQQ